MKLKGIIAGFCSIIMAVYFVGCEGSSVETAENTTEEKEPYYDGNLEGLDDLFISGNDILSYMHTPINCELTSAYIHKNENENSTQIYCVEYIIEFSDRYDYTFNKDYYMILDENYNYDSDSNEEFSDYDFQEFPYDNQNYIMVDANTIAKLNNESSLNCNIYNDMSKFFELINSFFK